MGDGKDISHIDAIQWGKNQERVAKIRYSQIFRENHQNCNIKNCELIIHKSIPYLGASPDGLVCCSCHGEGVLEIKCPRSIAMEQPNEHNVPYLLRSENRDLHLKRNHSYFAQCQGQMAITERKWCHFFVYSLAGFCFLEIAFDEIWWNELQSNLRFLLCLRSCAFEVAKLFSVGYYGYVVNGCISNFSEISRIMSVYALYY